MELFPSIRSEIRKQVSESHVPKIPFRFSGYALRTLDCYFEFYLSREISSLDQTGGGSVTGLEISSCSDQGFEWQNGLRECDSEKLSVSVNHPEIKSKISDSLFRRSEPQIFEAHHRTIPANQCDPYFGSDHQWSLTPMSGKLDKNNKAFSQAYLMTS